MEAVMRAASSGLALARNGFGAPLLLIMVLAMVVLPMPPFLLDLMFTFNIFVALVVIFVAVYTPRPLDFAIFPTVLLITTLMRLALNIASTRVVLLNGHAGPDSAGEVIAAFGEFVIGGNFAVGLVVFAILVIINFIVVTKGATRVSEVSARFTLDALPGKQMAIDADLNAGVIEQEEARVRRDEVMQEADFYGAMDGASKFVRGDAVAAVLILFVNLIGGLVIGASQHGLSFSEAGTVYTILTVGDGLVAQVPALLLSTAAGVIVTRVTTAQDMGAEILRQMFADPRALAVTSGILCILGLIPGMPNVVFLLLGAAGGWGAWSIYKRQHSGADTPPEVENAAQVRPVEELNWDDVPTVDPISLEIGYRLISLVEQGASAEVLARIRGVRKKLSQDYGFLIPSVHVKDNLELSPSTYRISIRGVVAGEGSLEADRLLAINPGQVSAKVPGATVVDPVFGMESVWIDASLQQQAQGYGYTVVDPGTVVATHLNNVITTFLPDVFGHEEAQSLLDRVKRAGASFVEDLIPEPLSMQVLVQVLQNLLRDDVGLKDMRLILETLANRVQQTQDILTLTAHVRVALRRSTMQKLFNNQAEIPVVALAPELEQLLFRTMNGGGADNSVMEPGLAAQIQTSLMSVKQTCEQLGEAPTVVVPFDLWAGFSTFVRRAVSGIQVISFDEIPDEKVIKVIATVGDQ
jgi:flagellar biosynthesis protein FlhA